MRHYEIVFLVHPDQSEQVGDMAERCRSLVEARQGKIHRLENWGMRKLAYPIRQVYKAYYILMNIECNEQLFQELQNNFRFNDAIIRHLIIRRERAITSPSPILTMKSQGKESQDRETHLSSTGTYDTTDKDAAAVTKADTPQPAPAQE